MCVCVRAPRAPDTGRWLRARWTGVQTFVEGKLSCIEISYKIRTFPIRNFPSLPCVYSNWLRPNRLSTTDNSLGSERPRPDDRALLGLMLSCITCPPFSVERPRLDSLGISSHSNTLWVEHANISNNQMYSAYHDGQTVRCWMSVQARHDLSYRFALRFLPGQLTGLSSDCCADLCKPYFFS